MTNQIVEKLNTILTKEKFSEPIVVYAMAGIRKIIEQEETPDRWKNLRFYCNWVLHHKLEKDSARQFIKPFEEIYQGIKDGTKSALYDEAAEISMFTAFKLEMSSFLKHFNIHNFTENRDVWQKFKLNYSSVIADCPLEAKNNNENDIIKKIIVTVQKTEMDGQQVFIINWNITPKQGLGAQLSIIDSHE